MFATGTCGQTMSSQMGEHPQKQNPSLSAKHQDKALIRQIQYYFISEVNNWIDWCFSG